MESTTGKIVAIRKDKVGTTLSQDHASGATTLVVTDPFEFDEDGGTLDVDGTTYTYTSWDDDASTITLTTGLVADAEAGTEVLLLPAETNMVAIVVEDESGEQIDADVRHGDALNLPEGQYPEPVTATLLFDGDRWLVDDIVGRTPTPDAGLLVGPPPAGFLDDTEFAADLAAAMTDIGDITEFGWITARIVEGDVIATALSGQRVQISTSGIAAYSAANVLTASLAAASGGLLLGGDLRVGGAAGISIDNGGSLHLNGGGQMNINDGGQLINWGTSTVTQVMSGELTVSTRSGSTLAEYPRTRLLTDRLTFDRTSTVTTSLRLDVNNDLLLDAPRDAWLRGTSRVVLAALGGDLDLRTSAYVTSTAIRDFQAATTNSRQVWVNISTGRLHTPSSARRMKRDFRPLVLPDPYAVLDLEPTLYRNKAEVAEWEANGTFTRTSQVLDDDGQPVLDEEGYPVELVEEVPLPEPGWEIGLVADDVEQIPGMEPFVQYDDGLTSGLHYDRMWESLIPALRDIVRRLDLIEGAP